MILYFVIATILQTLFANLAITPFYGLKLAPFFSILGLSALAQGFLCFFLRFGCWKAIVRYLTPPIDPEDNETNSRLAAAGLAKQRAEVGTILRGISSMVITFQNELGEHLDAVLASIQEIPEVSANRKMFQSLSATTANLAVLIRDFIDLCSCETGTLKLCEDHFCFLELIDSLRDFFQKVRMGGADSIRWEISVHAGIPETWFGDRARIQQVLTYLVRCACIAVKTNSGDKFVSLVVSPNEDVLMKGLKFTVVNNAVSSEWDGGFTVGGSRLEVHPDVARLLHQWLARLLKGQLIFSREIETGTNSVSFILPTGSTANGANHHPTVPAQRHFSLPAAAESYSVNNFQPTIEAPTAAFPTLASGRPRLASAAMQLDAPSAALGCGLSAADTDTCCPTVHEDGSGGEKSVATTNDHEGRASELGQEEDHHRNGENGEHGFSQSDIESPAENGRRVSSSTKGAGAAMHSHNNPLAAFYRHRLSNASQRRVDSETHLLYPESSEGLSPNST